MVKQLVRDSRYDMLKKYISTIKNKIPHKKLNSALIEKGWPKEWVEEALTEIEKSRKLSEELFSDSGDEEKKKEKKLPDKNKKKEGTKVVKKKKEKKRREASSESKKNLISKLQTLKKPKENGITISRGLSRLKSKIDDKPIKKETEFSNFLQDVKDSTTKKDFSKYDRFLNKDNGEKSSRMFSQLAAMSNNSNAELIAALTKHTDKTDKYLEKLFKQMDGKKHFYEVPELAEAKKPNVDKKSEVDILKEAIKLARDVVGEKNKAKAGKAPEGYPIAPPAGSPENPLAGVKEYMDENPDSDQLEEDSKLSAEFEAQKKLLDDEREAFKREREAFKREREKLLHPEINNVEEVKEQLSEAKAKGMETELLDSKLNLLEQRLKNMDAYSGDEKSKKADDLVVEEIEFVSEPVGDRAQTGIPGLDPVIQGGLRRKSSTLLAGGPGSGKTIFAMEYLVNGMEKFNEHGIYITLEQTKSELYDLFEDFGWDLKQYEKEKRLTILALTPEQLAKMVSAGGGSLRDSIDSVHAVRIVIDSITDIMMLYGTQTAKRQACANMFDLFKKMSCTTLAIAEQEVDPLKHVSDVLEYQVDGVILLYNERVGNVRQRAMEIFKMRGTKHAGKIFPLRINDSGLMVMTKSIKR